MAGALRKRLVSLGLAEPVEDEYMDEAGYEYEEEEYVPAGTVTTLPRAVPEPDLARIVTVHPTTYNEAREIGEAFRQGIPVIMNLTGMSEAEAKRMVDFSAGLTFGLEGFFERVTNRVFLLSPASVHVETESGEDEQRGRFFNQG